MVAVLGVHQGETAITDHLLLEIARLRHPAIRVLKTPQDREEGQGTDWEWWIGTPFSGWLRYAVQAKRINVETGRYDYLGHRVGGELQATILERFAAANGAIPLYCFYNYVERDRFEGFWHCHRRPIESEQLGCSVTPLGVVRDALATRGARCFDWIHNNDRSLPWRCLLRCPAFIRPFAKTPIAPEAEPLASAISYFGVTPTLYSSLPVEISFGPDFPSVVSVATGDINADFYS